MLTEADMLESFTVCVRFKITHFSYNFITLKSRDGASVIPSPDPFSLICDNNWINKKFETLMQLMVWFLTLPSGRKLVQFSLANLNQHGWPLVKLYTYKSPDKEFLFMLRRSDDKIRDPMDAIVMPKKWHHLCVAINGASNMVQGVVVCIRKHVHAMSTMVDLSHSLI